jgi:subtilisin family serine protease
VAKNVLLHAVRVLSCSGSGSTSGVVAGIDWVTANKQLPAVANMSLGGGADRALDDAVRRSIAAGVVYALAAGNDNRDACNTSPSRTAEGLTVGATTTSDARASFSNFGGCVDIFAPGHNITSSWHTSDADNKTISGTSMATPHVAGIAALYLGANPNASPNDVAKALMDNSTPSKVTNPGQCSPNKLGYMGFIGGSDHASSPGSAQ